MHAKHQSCENIENMQANMQQKVKDQLEYATFLVKW